MDPTEPTTTSHEQSITRRAPDVFTVQRVLRSESDAIADAAGRVDGRIAVALDTIYDTLGAVVVTGLGKSGLVGAKIAATLASTGTLAHFVHAAEALHGDSGRLQRGDCLIALSQSGRTQEVVTFAEIARSRGVPVVALTADPTSPLAVGATAWVDTHVRREADTHNLAPTSSTAVMLAIGDAFAIALMEARGTTIADFHANHPGGALGTRSASAIAEDDPR